MSGRVCYVSSTDRGDRLTAVRLIGARSEDSWRATSSTDPIAVLADVASAAGWIQERAAGGEGREAQLSLLCVDVEGANCTWLTAPSTDGRIVAAAMAQIGDGESSRFGSTWSTPTLNEASVEALAAKPKASTGTEAKSKLGLGRPSVPAGKGKAGPQRLAVLAIPDVSARLLLDSLDDRGISVERVISLWHAMAAAWDPAAARPGNSSADEIVVTSAPVSAVVLVDPAGRLVWSWSRGGELLAGGTIRLPQDRHELGTGIVRIGRAEIGRLTTDWLSWSVQLGAAPSRVICLLPTTGTEDDQDDLTPGAIGSAIGEAWPGVNVDVAVHDDPIGATLNRLVDGTSVHADDSRRELTLLTHRAGRAHRTLHMWAAGCLLAVSLGMGAIGWKAYGLASQTRARSGDSQAAISMMIRNVAPPQNTTQEFQARDTPRVYLESRLRTKRDSATPGIDPPRPILAELETLSYVLGTREVEIEELSFRLRGVDAYIRVPDTATAEMLKMSLDGIAETNCEWQGRFPPPQRMQRTGGSPEWRYQTNYHLAGEWRTEETPGTAGQSASTGGRP